jgi:hypothetical protein
MFANKACTQRQLLAVYDCFTKGSQIMIIKKKFRVSRPFIIASTIISLVATPAILMADASAPGAVKAKMHHRAKARPHARAKSRAMAKPQMQAPAPEMAEVAQPVYTPPPEPAPPAPVAEAAPAPAPAPAAPVAVAKSGGGTLLAVVGAAAVIAGIVALSSGGNSKSP